MTVTRTRLSVALIATTLAVAGASMSSTAFAAPTAAPAVTADGDGTRKVKSIRKNTPAEEPPLVLSGGSAGKGGNGGQDGAAWSWDQKWSSGPYLS
ncbi:hypothetical protein ACFY04_41465 [Streptomyces sp. NPDC001549]|uniref:hypothetical protein n=1 Tax=Streptomyces sp. NPDC001549 TaxID=3364586 RepID=UPI0036848E87